MYSSPSKITLPEVIVHHSWITMFTCTQVFRKHLNPLQAPKQPVIQSLDRCLLYYGTMCFPLGTMCLAMSSNLLLSHSSSFAGLTFVQTRPHACWVILPRTSFSLINTRPPIQPPSPTCPGNLFFGLFVFFGTAQVNSSVICSVCGVYPFEGKKNMRFCVLRCVACKTCFLRLSALIISNRVIGLSLRLYHEIMGLQENDPQSAHLAQIYHELLAFPGFPAILHTVPVISCTLPTFCSLFWLKTGTKQY